MNLGPHTVTRLRAETATDEYGNELPSGTDSRLDFTGCSVQPGTGGEYHADREAITTAYTVWLPGMPDIKATDRLEYAGVAYPIEGSPERWDFSPMAHTVVRLQRVDG